MLLYPTEKKYKINSDFGMRVHPKNDELKMHWGIDITAPTGSPVFCCYDGEIVTAKEHTDLGNFILQKIKIGSVNYFLYYCHLDKFNVNLNVNGNYPYDTVKKGDIIGYIGNTGRSTGPHLHFQICKNDAMTSNYKHNALDPQIFFKQNEEEC